MFRKATDFSTPEFNRMPDWFELKKHRLWNNPPTTGTWSQVAENSTSKVYSRFPRPPKELSSGYRSYLARTGEGNLFDPQLYVYPINKAKQLIHFSTYKSPFPPNVVDMSRKQMVTTIPDGDDPEKNPSIPVPDQPEEDPLGVLVRFGEVEKKYLPLYIKNVTVMDKNDPSSWDIFIKGRTQSHIMRKGKRIPKTKWTITNVVLEEKRVTKGGAEIVEDHFTVTLQDPDGTEVPLLLKGRVPVKALDPLAEDTYKLAFFPKGYMRGIRDGQKISLDYDGRKEVWTFNYNDGQPTLKRGKAVIKLNDFTRAELLEWRAEEAKKKESTEGEPGPEDDTGGYRIEDAP